MGVGAREHTRQAARYRASARSRGPGAPSLLWAEGIAAGGGILLFPTPAAGGQDEELSRRGLSVAVALIGMVLAAPLALIIAALIKLTSPGPVLYTQLRVGMDRRHPRSPMQSGRRVDDFGGRLFRIYKFRTMHEGADACGQVWATEDDPRVTAVGQMLRKTRLDELPQLINVLRGDMNIVGPRPEQPDIFRRLRVEVPGYDLRQQVRPGITGLAQVCQAYDRDVEDVRRKLRFDLEYVRNSSPAEDLRIMLRTFPVMLTRTYGW